jgi:membrane-associated protein
MDHLLSLLFSYRYLLLFPLAIIEGPMLSVLCGALCATGFFNPFIVFPLIVCGDVTGDSLYYSLGRWGVPAFAQKLGLGNRLTSPRMEAIRAYFETNPTRTISISKVILGVGIAGLYLAGNAKVPYRTFLSVCLGTSTALFAVYLTLGLCLGQAYLRINHYLSVITSLLVVIALALIFFFLLKSILKRA